MTSWRIPHQGCPGASTVGFADCRYDAVHYLERRALMQGSFHGDVRGRGLAAWGCLFTATYL
eukprot:8487259-Pyramimonas_sp.AAC.1